MDIVLKYHLGETSDIPDQRITKGDLLFVPLIGDVVQGNQKAGHPFGPTKFRITERRVSYHRTEMLIEFFTAKI